MVAPSKWNPKVKAKNRRWEKLSCAYLAFDAQRILCHLGGMSDEMGENLPPGLLETIENDVRTAKRRIADMDRECGLFLDESEKHWIVLEDAVADRDWYRVIVEAGEISEEIKKQMLQIMDTSPPSYAELMPDLESEIIKLWEEKYPNRAGK